VIEFKQGVLAGIVPGRMKIGLGFSRVRHKEVGARDSSRGGKRKGKALSKEKKPGREMVLPRQRPFYQGVMK